MIKIRLRRSLLFVPANRPELFDKALAGPADMICIELEDGVGLEQKDLARENMLTLLAGLSANNTGKRGTRAEILVRVNHPGTAAGQDDLSAFLSLQTRSVGLMLPKISTADELRSVEHHLQAHGFDGPLFLLIETNQGLEDCFGILRASSLLKMVLFGGVDLASALRCAPDWQPLLYARQRLIHAAASNGLDVMDMPYLHIADKEGLLHEAQAAAHIGFTGKAAIHPAQLAPIHEAFTPAENDICHAEKVVAAYQQAQAGVTVLEGRLVEKPVIDRMMRILALAKAAGLRSR
jgi:(S)-citramalyl-CoA lyase